VTADERIAVAMILALPDGPWDFSAGCKTAADFFGDVRHADDQQPWNRAAKAQPKPKREPRPDERLIK
jgi:hypothetical protein